ncbi:MAG: glycoside hydrolase family 9 protein [Candidatus Neomarinimicrobiota bacterium]
MKVIGSPSWAIIFAAILSCASSQDALMVNQLGYRPEDPKYVFATQPSDSFYVLDHMSEGVVFSAPLQLWITDDPTTGLTLYRGDFSNLSAPGDYLLQSSTGTRSATFSITDTVYDDVFRKALKAFYFNRCGMALTPEFAGAFSHQMCHIADAFYHASTGLSGFNESKGGWHDAGDFGKYTVNAGISVGTLLMAYELFPGKFRSDSLGTPESGNGIPDLLDEVRYELEWLLAMQDASGGAHHKLTAQNFAGEVMPENDKATRYIYEISSAATADLAAMMARAARVFRPFDQQFSDTCLATADAAWDFLLAHPDIVPAGGFTNPTGTVTGEYGDTSDEDERLWAAAELFAATGNESYHDYYLANYSAGDVLSSSMSWQNVEAMAHLTYLTAAVPGKDAITRQILRSALVGLCNALVERRNTYGFHVALEPGRYYWGSNSMIMNDAIALILCFEETGNSTYMHAALDQLHYILGVNAHDMTFITGVGTRSPRYPHHRASMSDGIDDPVPGFLAGGPNQYLNDPTLQAQFNWSTPPALCYLDNQNSWASNEVAINWNAALVFIVGYFGGPGAANGIQNGSQGFLPHDIRLHQNHPNPFNSSTNITFDLGSPQNVQLMVYNIRGGLASQVDLGWFATGSQRVIWSPTDAIGNLLSSGTYLYQLQGANWSEVRKMVYLK